MCLKFNLIRIHYYYFKTIEAMAEVSELLHLNYSRLPRASAGHIGYEDQGNLNKTDEDEQQVY